MRSRVRTRTHGSVGRRGPSGLLCMSATASWVRGSGISLDSSCAPVAAEASDRSAIMITKQGRRCIGHRFGQRGLPWTGTRLAGLMPIIAPCGIRTPGPTMVTNPLAPCLSNPVLIGVSSTDELQWPRTDRPKTDPGEVRLPSRSREAGRLCLREKSDSGQGNQDQLDASVPLTPFGGVIARDGVALAHAEGLHPRRRDIPGGEIIAHASGTPFGQRLIVFRRPGAVRVSRDLNEGLVVFP